MKYEIRTHEMFGNSIIRLDDDGTVWGIPMDENNSDYQKYLIDTNGGLPMPNES